MNLQGVKQLLEMNVSLQTVVNYMSRKGQDVLTPKQAKMVNEYYKIPGNMSDALDKMTAGGIGVLLTTLDNMAESGVMSPFNCVTVAVENSCSVSIEAEVVEIKDQKLHFTPGKVTTTSIKGDKTTMAINKGIVNVTRQGINGVRGVDIKPYSAFLTRAALIISNYCSIKNGVVVPVSLQGGQLQALGMKQWFKSNPENILKGGCKDLTKMFEECCPEALYQLGKKKTAKSVYATEFVHYLYIALLRYYVGFKEECIFLIQMFTKEIMSGPDTVLMSFDEGVTSVMLEPSFPDEVRDIVFEYKKRKATFAQALHGLEISRGMRGTDHKERAPASRSSYAGMIISGEIVELMYLSVNLSKFVTNYKFIALVECDVNMTLRILKCLAAMKWTGVVFIDNNPSFGIVLRSCNDKNDKDLYYVGECTDFRVKMCGVTGFLYTKTLGMEYKDVVIFDGSVPDSSIKVQTSDDDYEEHYAHPRSIRKLKWVQCKYPIFGQTMVFPRFFGFLEKGAKYYDPAFIADPRFRQYGLFSGVQIHNLKLWEYYGVDVVEGKALIDNPKESNSWYYHIRPEMIEIDKELVGDKDLLREKQFSEIYCASVVANLGRMQYIYTGLPPGKLLTLLGFKFPPIPVSLVAKMKVKIASSSNLGLYAKSYENLSSEQADLLSSQMDVTNRSVMLAVRGNLSDYQGEKPVDKKKGFYTEVVSDEVDLGDEGRSPDDDRV